MATLGFKSTRRRAVLSSSIDQEATMNRVRRFSILAAGLALGLGAHALSPLAQEAGKVSVTLKDHKFSPAELTAPAGKPIVIEVVNQDTTPAEFESKPLRVEKVVPGSGTITVQVRPLPPGRYRFFDDYHESTTVGFLVAQ
jgi:plastocyanin